MKSLLEGIVNGDSTKFDALIETVQTSVSIGSTSATCHFHCICLDGNGRPKTGVLIDYLISCLVDYAIPRKRISEALEHSKTNNSFEMGASLVSEAKGLFTREKTTGEGGELILYLFAEKLLKLPQLACKMNLKTSTAMHVHGADGLHVGVDEDKNKLCLYWGESKFHASVNNAISKCMKSIAPLLNSTSEAGSAGHRDIQILQQYLNVDNPELEIVLKNYLNPDHKNFNSVEFRGLCVVGFDSAAYPATPNTQSMAQVKLELISELNKLQNNIENRIIAEKIKSFSIHVFLLPFPSLSVFREDFIKKLI